MWVESEEGVGSNFQFTIKSTAEKTVCYDATREVELTEKLLGRRLLVVEENERIASVLDQYCKHWMLGADFVTGGEAAVEALSKRSYDLVIANSSLKEMTPNQFLDKIVEGDNGDKLKTILLCPVGKQSMGVKWAATATKPFKPLSLLETFSRVLNGTSKKNVARVEKSSKEKMGVCCPLKILLAEDNTVNQKVATLMLKRQGYKADIANNGLEVLEAMERQRYDLILMDIQMPEMDGYEATRAITEKYHEDERPYIIALTANAMQGDRELAIDAGMDDYMSKPMKGPVLEKGLQSAYDAISSRVKR